MYSSKTEQDVSKVNPNTLKTVHTGLFVKWETCSLLLRIVQEFLRDRFKTTALKGPRRPNNTCEVLLQALYPSGAHFPGSQDLLESYLNMIKESKPDIYVEKQTQVIDLVDDNNETCITLDDTLDESVLVIEENVPAKDKAVQQKRSSVETGCSNWDVSQTHCQDDVLIVDSSSPNKCSSFESASNVETRSVLKESNQQRKRKRLIEKEEDRSVIEVVDDDVIVLDDSFPDSTNSVTLQSNSFNQRASDWEVTVVQPNSCNKKVSKLKVTMTGDQRTVQKRPVNNFNHMSTKQVPIRVSGNCKINVNNKRCRAESPQPSSSTAHKKMRKLTYNRPAHLRQPLTQSSPEDIPKAESNIYNAEVVETRTGLRPIVIDGNNVGVSHGKGIFSLKGVKICINYFERRGHRHIKTFLPHYRTNKNTHDELRLMERKGTVVLTPSRKVDGRTVASYDDRYIVQYATEMGGVVVSTDNFRDLQEENPAWKETIRERLLMFTWVDDVLMFPQDPLGRNGPSLDNLLKFPDPS